MTVKELIAKLETFDQDAVILEEHKDELRELAELDVTFHEETEGMETDDGWQLGGPAVVFDAWS